MKNVPLKILLAIFLLAIVSCQVEEDLQNVDELSIETNENEELSKSSPYEEVCTAYGIPAGYRVIDLVYRSYCPSQGGYAPNTAIIERIHGVPKIFRAGAGCDDQYCIWIVGDNFEPNAYVDVRTTRGSSIIGTYRGADRVQYVSDQGQDVITIRLRTAFERNQFAGQGLRIWVVNPQARKWADGRTVRRPRIDPPGNGDCHERPCINP